VTGAIVSQPDNEKTGATKLLGKDADSCAVTFVTTPEGYFVIDVGWLMGDPMVLC
jgi:hypothetical protein